MIQNSLKVFVLTLFAVTLLISAVSASGISVPYWDSADNPNPLKMFVGESRDIKAELQNMVGDQPVTFRVTISEGSEVATITDATTDYTVQPQTREMVSIHIQPPSTATVGQSYKVKISAQTIENPGSQQFRMGSAMDVSFDVVLIDRPAPVQAQVDESLSEESTVSPTLLIAVVAVLVLVFVIVFLILKKKK